MIVLGPALGRGYILQFDMVFVPHVHIGFNALRNGTSSYQSIPSTVLLKALGYLAPMDIVQKGILWLLFFGSSLLFYISMPVKSRSARVFGALFYTYNPFTYDRFMAGHWLLLAAYSVMPLLVRQFHRFFVRSSMREAFHVSALWTVIVLLSPHHVLIAGFLYVSFAVFFVRTRRVLLLSIMIPLLVLLLNSWWLLPLYFGHNFSGGFSIDQFRAFATHADNRYGLLITMLSLQGFWHQEWRSIASYYSWWTLLTALWLLPVSFGIGTLHLFSRDKRKIVYALALASGFSLLIASGPAPPFGAINMWLFLHIPGFSGLREPEKLLSILALFYSVIICYACYSVIVFKRRMLTAISGSVMVVIVGLLLWPFVWGAHGQVFAVHYPVSWEQLNTQLQQLPSSEKVLILPRDLYIKKSFVHTLVANPANAYYGDRTIPSERIRIPGVSEFNPQEYKGLETALESKDLSLLQSESADLHIRFIMLVKSQDDAR
ncbi:MAG: hypothetical protein NVSMB46_06420 [Candidatus Saccharimonadales bacterium]